MTAESRLERIESRQEDLIRAFMKLTETIGVLSGQMAEMVEWAQTPPSTDLGDTMRELLLIGKNTQGTLVHLGNEVRALPRRVAEVVQTELAPHG